MSGLLDRRYGRASGGRWTLVAPLAKVQNLGGIYMRSVDGRYVITATRYRGGDKYRRYYGITFRTVEYASGDSRTGGASTLLYDGSSLEKAKAAAPSV